MMQESPKILGLSHGLVGIVLVGFGFAVPADSLAAEYSFGYEIDAGYEYNNNVRLTPEDELDISGGQLSVPLTFTRATERLRSELTGDLTFSKYNESEWDSNDQRFEGSTEYTMERGDLDGYVSYIRDSTRTSEFDDTGLVGIDASRREAVQVGGSVSNLFTEKNGVTAGLDYRAVDYDAPQLDDFDYSSGYIGWLHRWSEMTRLRLQLYGSWFENDNNDLTDVESDTLGVQAGFDSDLSESFYTSLLVGWATVDTDYSSPEIDDDESDTLLVQGLLRYSAERYQLTARLSSEPSPTGSGTLYARNRLDLDYVYQLTERSQFELGLTGGEQTAVDDRIENDRDYYQGKVGLSYQFAEHWFISGRYRYQFQDREQEDGDADSHEVLLSVIFRPNAWVWSR